MPRRLLPVLLFIIATSALADSFKAITFTPSSLDSHTALSAVVAGTSAGGCAPTHGTSSVSGSTITLTVEQRSSFLPCLTIQAPFVLPVFIGTLAPGNYDLVTKFGSTEVDRRSLAIADADPPFRIEENVGLTGGNAAVALQLREPDIGLSLVQPTVTFDGTAGTVVDRGLDHLLVIPPAHAPGPATVKLIRGGQTLTAVNAFRYVDAFAPVDRAAYESILIPLVFAGSGAFQSLWTTELWVHNQNDYDVVQFNGPFTVRFCIAGPCLQPIEAHQTVKLGFGQDSSPFPHGRIMYVPHQSADGLQFSLRIRDTNRQSESHGVEIPVVRERELRGSKFSLLNIPGDAQYRARLRIYSLDAPSGAVTVRLLTVSFPETQVAQWLLFMDPPSPVDVPAYGEIDLDQAIRASKEPGPYRLQIDPPFLTAAPSYWAFVSITNNQTQNVTIVTPQ